jgi:hypothetical protein
MLKVHTASVKQDHLSNDKHLSYLARVAGPRQSVVKLIRFRWHAKHEGVRNTYPVNVGLPTLCLLLAQEDEEPFVTIEYRQSQNWQPSCGSQGWNP